MTERPAPGHGPGPWRGVFVIADVQRRWPFSLRAAFCMAVPIAVGWAAGEVALGLVATIGAFTALYGSGRPYLNRAVYLAVIALCFGVAVGIGVWAAAVPWTVVPVIATIAIIAVLVCNALSVGPPGAYMFVLACAAGTGAAPEGINPLLIGLLVTAGGAVAWVVHMASALVWPRGPEKSAVSAAADAVASYIDAIGTPEEASARHWASVALHEAWNALVSFQPIRPRPNSTLHRLRSISHELHQLFAESMEAAGSHAPRAGCSQRARALGAQAHRPPDIEGGDAGVPPLGRANAIDQLRQAISPGSRSLVVVARAGLAVVISGLIAGALGVDHAYWAMTAAVLMLYQGFDQTRMLTRSLQRLLGTLVGLILAGVILMAHPGGLWLALIIAVLQFATEMFVVRNYALAVVFITPAALTIASGGQPVPNIGVMLIARGVDTLIGCAVAIAVHFLTSRSDSDAGLPAAVAATLDAVKPVAHHLAAGQVTSRAARVARRDLQIRAITLLPTYTAATGGSSMERAAAERMWPAVSTTEQLAYHTLASCWVVEGAKDRAPDVGLTLFGPGGASSFEAACDELAASVRSGNRPAEPCETPVFAAEEIDAVRESLVRTG